MRFKYLSFICLILLAAVQSTAAHADPKDRAICADCGAHQPGGQLDVKLPVVPVPPPDEKAYCAQLEVSLSGNDCFAKPFIGWGRTLADAKASARSNCRSKCPSDRKKCSNGFSAAFTDCK